MRASKKMVGGLLAGLGIPVAMILGLLIAPTSQAAVTYTAATVSTHNTAANCWTIVSGGVYNVTGWIAQHPGGTAPIIGMCGGDGTAAFNSVHSASGTAKTTLAGYRIGDLAAATATPTPTPTPTPAPTSTTPGLPAYSATDLAGHATAANCWVAISGNVYNLTAFARTHSGGAARITAQCGKDGSAAFTGQHASSSASKLTVLAPYKIGTYSGGTVATTTPTPTPTPTPTTPTTPSTAYTLAQVATHNTAANCWVIISANVYNLTAFAPTHSGGAARITAQCGKDGSAAFTGQHASSSASKLTVLAPYKVGTYSAGTTTPTPTPSTAYTLAQVATHNTAANCWVIISANVYNLTAFAPTHSGGAARITAQCGKDGSAAFTGQHASSSAAKLTVLAPYKVGTYSAGTTPTPTTPPTTAYTLAQVATHSTLANCWVIISTKVYNLTAFSATHSGGSAVISNVCGKDGSVTFTSQHSSTQAAKLTILSAYQVGTYTSTTPTTPTGGTYVMSQLTTHSTQADCWSVVNGFVYNLTNWIAQHPGGPAPILSMCGADGTVAFVTKHSTATSYAALDAFKIGTLLGWVAPTLPNLNVAALGGNGQYTMADVAKHSGAGDCWSAIGGSVYNLTSWVGVHPGGGGVITAMCGLDGTGSYSGKHGGSASAGAVLTKLRIGSLVASASKVMVQYSAAEVAKHSTATDCWSIVNGNVYDLTGWVNKHPGGPSVIVAMCGNDGTAMFAGKHGSSTSATSALGQYQIGFLDSVAVPEGVTAASGPIVKVITARQVIRHSSGRNCWTIANGNVYNLTPWTKRHPGRKAFINSMCGKNGTVAVNKTTGSIKKSNTMLQRYLIGKVGRPAATAPTPTGAAGTYTLADVAGHKATSSCWSAVNGNVYDLTKWVPLHPGGAGVITGMCGKDGSASYNSMHKGSAKAASALAQYLIGKLA